MADPAELLDLLAKPDGSGRGFAAIASMQSRAAGATMMKRIDSRSRTLAVWSGSLTG